MRQKCPGQDRRYWTADAAYMVPCRKCGRPVEFFKDDRSRKCPRCGARFKNPRQDLSCAAWCRYARECLDFTGDRQEPKNSGR